MDPSANFDLNRALARWRQNLAAREGCTPERVRELESHLLESAADWRGRGLTEEEAFWISARRLGDTDVLAAQFIRADPESVWRTRIFWMVVGILVIPVVQFLTGTLGAAAIYLCHRFDVPVPGVLIAFAASVLFIAAMVGLLRGLAGGRWPRLSRRFEAFFSCRRQFAWQLLLLAAMPLLVSLGALAAFSWFRANGGLPEHFSRASDWGAMANMRIIFFTQSVLWPVALALLAARYAPTRPQAE